MLTSFFIIPTLPWTLLNAKKEAGKKPKQKVSISQIKFIEAVNTCINVK